MNNFQNHELLGSWNTEDRSQKPLPTIDRHLPCQREALVIAQISQCERLDVGFRLVNLRRVLFDFGFYL